MAPGPRCSMMHLAHLQVTDVSDYGSFKTISVLQMGILLQEGRMPSAEIPFSQLHPDYPEWPET